MDRHDFDPERDLSKGPYEKRGFTIELQKRIEESIERKSRAARFKGPIIASAIIMLTFSFLFMEWQGWPWEQQQTSLSAVSASQMKAADAPTRDAASAVRSFDSGLLLGLRTDYNRKDVKLTPDESADSSYRTIYIAPLNGQLDLAAEGKGILLPYGQYFWKLDSVTETAGDSVYSTLIAHPANKPVPARTHAGVSPQLVRHSERLLFVGNKYVTLEQSEASGTGRKLAHTKRVWVKELKQVNGDMTLPESEPGQRSYVSAQDIFGSALQGKPSDEWAIVRRPGSWMPFMAKTSIAGNDESYDLDPITLTLPDAVVSHDQLCCTWAEIKRAQPDAIDALSSPKKDFVAVITPASIYFYEDRRGKLGESPILTINLNENETLVMAQWATGSYVEEWAKASRNLLGTM